MRLPTVATLRARMTAEMERMKMEMERVAAASPAAPPAAPPTMLTAGGDDGKPPAAAGSAGKAKKEKKAPPPPQVKKVKVKHPLHRSTRRRTRMP